MRLYLLLLLILLMPGVQAQRTANNFHHLTPNEGLSNDAVRGIGRDKYGFIWLGTNYGVNRFDGVQIKTWFNNPSDSTSLPNNFVRSLFGDSRGRIWIGSDPGFSEYDYQSNSFRRYTNERFNMVDIDEDVNGDIWVATNRGLKKIDTAKRTLLDIEFRQDSLLSQILNGSIRDIHCDANGGIYMATGNGVLIYNESKKSLTRITAETHPGLLPSNDITAITTDHKHQLLVGCRAGTGILIKINLSSGTAVQYDDFNRANATNTPNTITKLYTDRQGRIWLGSSFWGLMLFDEKTGAIVKYQGSPLLQNSMNGTHASCFMQDPNGMLWVGTEGYGVNYFNPDQDIFSSIQMNQFLPKTLADNWTRAATEDAQGNLWIGTGKGLSVYNPRHEPILNFTNEDTLYRALQSLSVRCLSSDPDGSVWIGTALGVNRYQPKTARMIAYDERDSVPRSFTWFIKRTRSGRTLVGNNRGLFEYRVASNTFYDYRKHPQLGKYNYGLRCFLEDSKGRWWIGTFNFGVLVYDPQSEKVLMHIQRDSTRRGLSSNFLHDIQEDKHGNIWISTRYKLNCYHPATDSISIYSEKDGLPSDWVGSVLIDSMDRLWISTGKGLSVMNAQRKIMKTFSLQDGLLTTQFNDQPGYRMRDGRFVFPSLKGILIVNPLNFNWRDQSPVPFITSFRVLNKERITDLNLEEMKEISLAPEENFFSIDLVGLQFYHPEQNWYAYKLEGFDKDWIYTRKPTINYTNVPGGDYVFHYKSSSSINDWNVSAKSIKIYVATVFYKTTWFRILAAMLFSAGLLAFYRYRIRQKERVMQLEGKAQSLEKEKAMVMYENLKQQLNPHFLFNSLTSLSGLIESDQKMAGNFLEQMSKIYRYILKNRDSEVVSLKEELDFVQVFINLQRTRFRDGLKVYINVNPDLLQMKIAPVTLQNLVENAIKHNIIDIDSPLQVDIYTDSNYVVVRNNLQKKNMVETSNKQGLASLKSLYQYLTSKPIVIEESNTHFSIRIPLI